jgi:eukaryotic-like serine/threonine-protein kinase
MAAQSPASSNTADSAIVTGTLVGGRFEVEREEASGPLGRLLLARDQKTKKPIAVFVLAESLAVDRASVETFRGEARSAAKLKHRNLVAIYGVGTHAGREHFIAHEWMSGQTAAQLIAARTTDSPMSLRGVYNLVTHVCKALSAIHELTVHGALRPQTVWVSKSGRVKLGEIGVGAALAKTRSWQLLAPDEQAYLAPEVRAGAAASQRSDVFGVGALLYALLTSRSPSDAFVAPSQARSDATAELDEVLMRCLASDPDQRFGTPDEIVQALLPLCADAPEPTRPDFEVDVEVDVDVAHSSRPGAIVRRSMPPSSSHPPIDIAIGQTVPPPSLSPEISLPELPVVVASLPASPPPPSVAGARPPVPPARLVGRAPANTNGSPLATPLAERVGPAARVTPAASAGPDIAALTARLTQNDAPRWMAVKNGMDHGPFTTRELIKLIVDGDVLEQHFVFTLSSAEQKPLSAYPEFAEFVVQYKLRKEERDHAQALEHSTKVEKRSTAAKALILLASIGLIVVVGVSYFLSRRAADARAHKAELDLAALYESGQVKIAGTAGILKHTPRPGGARRSGAPQTGGGFSSYEDAMNQAMELGDATKGGGERQLTSNDVAGIMNRNLNRMFTCVGDELRHGAKLSRVTIDVAILGSGRVMGASVNTGSANFQRCIVTKVRELQFPNFPAPRMGARYSFNVD